jgi:iron-sulfur cluster protein
MRSHTLILKSIMLRKSGRIHHDLLAKRVEEALSNQIQRRAVLTATLHVRRKSLEMYSKFSDSEKLLADSRRIKRESISNLRSNVARFISKAESNGITVYAARTKKDAVDYIVRVLTRINAQTVVKTKSMTCEELELNQHLSDAGFTVIETDLGERILQMAGQKPSHLVAPAVHLTSSQVAAIFSKSLGVEVPGVAEEITKIARKTLRQVFLAADVGISGANLAIAEDGSVLIVTNEGNERLVTSLPAVYIAVIGIEKIVSSLSDALKLTQALCMSATAQRMTSYISIIKGPNDRTGISLPGERHETHVVLLDNGRSEIAEDEFFRQALYCLKCGSCLNVCPTYREVGGHVFGSTYTGPIGIPWTSFTSGYGAAAEFAPLCVSCGICKLACPEDINIPILIAKVKETIVKSEGQLPVNWFLSHYESFVRLMSRTAPISNRLLSNSTFRWLLEKTVGIDRRRRFPKFERKTFEGWHRKQKQRDGTDLVYFVDTYANLNNSEIGKATFSILTRCGYKVLLPPQRGSGMPAFLYGELPLLKETAEFNVNSLLPYARQGIPIVATEPTAAFCLRELYPELLRTEDSRTVAKNSYEMLGFLRDLWDKLPPKTELSRKFTGKVAYHTPCHTRALYTNFPGPALLREAGLQVEIPDFEGCCGIGGTYGYKKGLDGFDVSMAVGEELFDRIRDTKPEYVVTESSVCKIQIEQGLGLKVKHPLEILSEAFGLR